MYWHRWFVVRLAIILMMTLLAGDALGQGIGMGIGLMDTQRRAAGVVSPGTFLLLNTGSGGPYILLNAGGKIQCNAC